MRVYRGKLLTHMNQQILLGLFLTNTLSIFYFSMPAWVAQLDARLTGDQYVVDSNPAGSGNIISWKLK